MAGKTQAKTGKAQAKTQAGKAQAKQPRFADKAEQDACFNDARADVWAQAKIAPTKETKPLVNTAVWHAMKHAGDYDKGVAAGLAALAPYLPKPAAKRATASKPAQASKPATSKAQTGASKTKTTASKSTTGTRKTR